MAGGRPDAKVDLDGGEQVDSGQQAAVRRPGSEASRHPGIAHAQTGCVAPKLFLRLGSPAIRASRRESRRPGGSLGVQVLR